MPYPTREPDDFVPFPLGRLLGIGAMVSVAIVVLMPLVEALDWPYWADLLLAIGVGLAGGMVRNLVRRLRARRPTAGIQQTADADHRNDHLEGQESDPRH